MSNVDWITAVLKCKAEDGPGFLVDFYNFAEDLEEVKDLHFLIRDRLDDDVVFSFRFLTEKKNHRIVSSKVAFKLRELISKDNFVVDPEATHPLHKFAAFPWKQTVKERGAEKFTLFCRFLSKLSKVAVDMTRAGYFSSKERVEIAHVMSWMHGMRVNQSERNPDRLFRPNRRKKSRISKASTFEPLANQRLEEFDLLVPSSWESNSVG